MVWLQFGKFLFNFQAIHRLQAAPPCGKSLPDKRCCSSGVEHVIGNDEVGGSIPLNSTTFFFISTSCQRGTFRALASYLLRKRMEVIES